MEKLKLKHMSIAFSNNQEVFYFDDERELNQICKIVELRQEELTISNREYQYDVLFDDIKLLLRPLSYLKKDEYFDMYMDLCEEMETLSCEYLLEALINKTSYSIGIHRMEILENWMYRNQFDWRHDLIKKGLAIDINTLNP